MNPTEPIDMLIEKRRIKFTLNEKLDNEKNHMKYA